MGGDYTENFRVNKKANALLRPLYAIVKYCWLGVCKAEEELSNG